MDPHDLYWIYLAEACGPGTDLAVRLVRHCGSAAAVYEAGPDLLRAEGLFRDKQYDRYANCSFDACLSIYERCQNQRIGLLSYENPLYPARLRDIQNPPALLYYRGMLPAFDRMLAVGVVGTRAMGEVGRQYTYRMSYELAAAGAAVVSGLALGVDAAASAAALDAKGTTAAVLGCAIDRCYPKENQALYDRMVQSGCLLSEYAPGTSTGRYAFPQRNRIISGLCQALLVTEAGIGSGSLITAAHALSQGRDLFAIPGDPTKKEHAGTNQLIKNGAYPVTETAELLSHYAELYDETLFPDRIPDALLSPAYDDSVRFGAEAIAKRRAELERIARAEEAAQAAALDAARRERAARTAQTPEVKQAPEEIPLREEPLFSDGQGYEILPSRTEPESEPVRPPHPEPFCPADRRPKSRPDIVPAQAAKKSAKPDMIPVQAAQKSMKPDMIPVQAAQKSMKPDIVPVQAAHKSAKPDMIPVQAHKAAPPAPKRPAEKPHRPGKPSDVPSAPKRAADMPEDSLTVMQRKILALIRDHASFDRMCAELLLSPQNLMSDLSCLELGGYIIALPGGIYQYIE